MLLIMMLVAARSKLKRSVRFGPRERVTSLGSTNDFLVTSRYVLQGMFYKDQRSSGKILASVLKLLDMDWCVNFFSVIDLAGIIGSKFYLSEFHEMCKVSKIFCLSIVLLNTCYLIF